MQWAAATFDVLGIQNERGRRGMETAKEMRAYISAEGVPEKLKPGGWTARLHDLVDEGHITREMLPMLFRDYIAPSLDTTISATGQLFFQLGRNPDVWDRIHRDSAMIPCVVDEAVRIGSPIRSFSRTLTRSFEIGGVTLPQGARVMCLYASANHDKQRFPEPERFDLDRPGPQHLGFGHGIHQCVGMHLARLEMQSLLRAMVPRVARFILGNSTVCLNNTIYGFQSMPMRLEPGEPVAVLRQVPTAREARAAPPSAPDLAHWRDMRIVLRRVQVEDIVSFDLEAADGKALPFVTAGAHIDVEVVPGLVRQYSLCNDPADSTKRYRIAMLRDRASRGGSRGIHESWESGQTIRAGLPRNTFPLNEEGRRAILVAGGVGLTPMLSMAYRLQTLGRNFSLHYCIRTARRAAFLEDISERGLLPHLCVHVSDGRTEQRFIAAVALGAPDPGTDVYCCGPNGMMDAVAAVAAELGWPAKQVHLERFGAATRSDDQPFTVVANRSGRTIEVAAGQTILEALTTVGIEVHSSCGAGVCATCLTPVLCGVPDHRDLVLTEQEKAANRQIAVCCSRSLSRISVLDI